MSNWKTFLQKQKSLRFRLPPGWDTTDAVAEALGCARDRVRAEMAPLIKARVVESQQFPVWSDATKRVERITAYRQIAAKA